MWTRIAAPVAVLALGLVAAAPAQATPAQGLKRAAFKVTVDGVQTTTWKTDHPGSGGCDTAVNGSGTERVRFTSKPVFMRATVLEGLSAPVLSGRGFREPNARLRGTVVRDGNLDAAPGGQCGGAGGGSIARDCGTRSFSGLGMPISYRLLAKPRDQLDVRPDVIDDPFKNCPSGGYAFPTLVNANEGVPVRADLPRDELFDRSLGKIIVIARGQESETAGEDTYLTKIRWVITLERVGARQRRR